MTGNLLVTPEKLISTAQEFSSCGSQVNSITQQMLQIVRSMNTLWSGEANTAYATKFNALEDDMTKINRMISEHATDLQEMARNYQQAEALNVETASALQQDVIS